VADITATEAARRFADVLDAVEHGGQRFTITRHGKAVAHLEPVTRGRGADVKALLRDHEPDAAWGADLATVRDLLDVDVRP
jgi:prevent-host-death family protein